MFLREFLNLEEKPGCNMTEEGRACPEHGLNECPGYKMIETSAQDKLHQRHQDQRKKSGLPNPDYYKELKATFDLPDEERWAAVAKIKKKYGVEEAARLGTKLGTRRDRFKSLRKNEGVREARKSDYNFDIEDIKKLEKIRDLPTLKTLAFQLISKPSAKPMKPEKVEWFKSALERMDSPLKVIKLMYDLMLSGEGHAVIGSKHSMKANTYRDRFGEDVDEAQVWSSPNQKMQHHTEFPHTHTVARDIRSSMTGDVMLQKGERLSELGDNLWLNLDTGVQPFRVEAGERRGLIVRVKQGVEEAIPYALSAANAAAEYRRQGAAGGGYRGRIDIPVQSKEDYVAVGKVLLRAAKAAGQKIDYGLSDGVMSIFSDSMTSDELDQFIDHVLDQGLAEATGDKSFDSMMKGIVKGTKKQAAADRREQKKQDQERAKAAFGPNPADKLSIRKPGVAEAGPFSYGAKKPRKGSVADLAARKRKEQEHGRQPIEPKDQMVGVAKVLPKDVAETNPGISKDQETKFHTKLDTLVHDTFGKRRGEMEEGLMPGEYYTYKITFDDGTSDTINVTSDEFNFRSYYAKKGKNVARVEQQGGVQGSGYGSSTADPYADARERQGQERAAFRAHDRRLAEDIEKYLEELERAGYAVREEKVRLDPKCWKGKKIGNPKTKIKGGVRVNNCVPK